MKFSFYTHKFDLGNHVAYYNSLRMKPVYLTKSESEILEQDLIKGNIVNLDEKIVLSLLKYKIVIRDDINIKTEVLKYMPRPYVSIAYFVLTEQCNLACKYCFLGNANKNANKVTNYPMSIETADQALKFFARQTIQKQEEFNDEKEIIFYGGEPLLNYETLKYVVNKSKILQTQGILSNRLRYSIVTNGLLLSDEIIGFFKENNINMSISIDGASAKANVHRVDRVGNCIFERLIANIKKARKAGLTFGLSITITEETMENIDELFEFIKKIDIKSVCLNILFKYNDSEIDSSYYERATIFIIEFYKRARELGIYEDRFMRKLLAFMESSIYYSDCAATTGSQIILTPDGGVGICHGCMETRDFFVGSIWDENLIVEKNTVFMKWSQLSPLFREECQSCPALGICGGGCPINASKVNEDHSINGIDSTFCIHAKTVLLFLIEELLRLMLDNYEQENETQIGDFKEEK